MDQPEIERTIETESLKQCSKYTKLTGKKLQVVLFCLSMGNLIPGYLIAIELGNLKKPTHKLNILYTEYKLLSIFDFVMGVVGILWMLLDMFYINPRIEEQRKQENVQKEMQYLMNLNSIRSPPSPTISGREENTESDLVLPKPSENHRIKVNGKKSSASMSSVTPKFYRDAGGFRGRMITLKRYNSLHKMRSRS